MIRFSVLVALALSAAAPALARDAAKMPLVGVLRINTPATNEPGATMLREALADVGDVDGHNLRLEFRLAEGHAERYPAMAERLVRDGASVIIAYGVPPVRAAQNVTTTIPIVAVAYDLVDAGFIKSLAKPGGNNHRGQHSIPRARHEETRHSQRDRAGGATLRSVDRACSQFTQVAASDRRLSRHARRRAANHRRHGSRRFCLGVCLLQGRRRGSRHLG
jgi:hypothetical protein